MLLRNTQSLANAKLRKAFLIEAGVSAVQFFGVALREAM
jgi:hypothetical protein